MRLLWLADVLRAAGLTVHEVSGWKTRGSDTYGPVRGITCHETQGSLRSTDAGEIGVLLNGSATANPPIAQLYLSRSGAWHVVASGTCYHNKTGWAGPNKGYGNDALLGIEAQHAKGEPWTALQYESYVRGVAALVAHKASGYDVAVSRVGGHFEHQPGEKSDPGFDMNVFRRRVADVLSGDDMAVNQQDFDALIWRLEALINNRPTVIGGPLKGERNVLAATLGDVQARIAAEQARDAALSATVEALAEMVRQGGGDVDAAAILSRIDDRVTEVKAQITEVHQDEMARLAEVMQQALRDRDARIASLETELDGLRGGDAAPQG